MTIGEFPDDETFAQFALANNGDGDVSTTTHKAFIEAEYRDLSAGIPR